MKKLIQSLIFKVPSLPCKRAFGYWMLPFVVWTLFLTGCAVGPNYKRPSINAPETFRGEIEISTNSFASLPWWQVFHDETLQNLIRTALTNNYDLRIAVTRVEQARAMAAQARAGFFPQINYAATAARGKNVGGGNTPSPTGTIGNVFAADVNASWEIDLWGAIGQALAQVTAQDAFGWFTSCGYSFC